MSISLLSSLESYAFFFPFECLKSFFKDVSLRNSPTDVAFVLSHAEVSLHVVPGVSQLSRCKVADRTHEGLGSCKTKYGERVHIQQ